MSVDVSSMVRDTMYGKTLRKSFAKMDEIEDMPNLLEIQKKSYQWFLDTGLREVFRDVAAITDYSGNLELTFIDSPAGKYIDVMPIAVVNEVISADIYWYQSNTETTAATQGFLEDLTELAAGSENLQAIMGEHDKVRLANSPYLLWATNLPTYTPVLRGDWAAKLPSCAAVAEDPTVDNWVARQDDATLRSLVNSLFTVFEATGEETFHSMTTKKMRSAELMMAAFRALPREKQRELLAATGRLVQSTGASAKEMLDENKDEN